MIHRNVICHGRPEPLPVRTELRAGPLTAVFTAGELRYLRLGSTEVLRRIYMALRDQNWGTVPAALSNLTIDRQEQSFRIRYLADHREGGIHFQWTATIEGGETGTITFSLDGKALTTFKRNRIGFCILHPLDGCAGRPCEVEKVDGSREKGAFPLLVAPHQPFIDMRAVTHEVATGLHAEVRFEGDSFEMEDHRNWTDASYKTYGTPLRLPYPATVEAGTVIRQSIKLTLRGQALAPVAKPGSPISFSIREQPARPLPCIGLGMASHGRPLSAREVERLKSLRLSHLRVDTGGDALKRAAIETRTLGVPLEVALVDEAPVADPQVPVKHWLVFDPRRPSPAGPRVAGSNANFAELNRARPSITGLAGVCFAVNPQVHAFDNDVLVENVAAQAACVETARQFAPGAAIVVSPVTLKPRFNAVATGSETPPAPGELPPQVDPRQMSLLGACWTLGSLKHLAESGAASVTYYETTGWRGVMETEAGSSVPARFPSIPGAVFPLYHVLADAGEFAGGEVLTSVSTQPLAVDGLVLRKGGRLCILLANFTPETQRVSLNLTGPLKVRRLDENTAERAMREPEQWRAAPGEKSGPLLKLSPYSILRIDGGRF
jgi:D-apionolactonase